MFEEAALELARRRLFSSYGCHRRRRLSLRGGDFFPPTGTIGGGGRPCAAAISFPLPGTTGGSGQACMAATSFPPTGTIGGGGRDCVNGVPCACGHHGRCARSASNFGGFSPA
ncbi:hypothetical protein MTO96_012777 [Rhipicephalus appendiculatus]